MPPERACGRQMFTLPSPAWTMGSPRRFRSPKSARRPAHSASPGRIHENARNIVYHEGLGGVWRLARDPAGGGSTILSADRPGKRGRQVGEAYLLRIGGAGYAASGALGNRNG